VELGPAHRRQPGEDRDVADGVDEEHPAGADRGDGGAGRGRTDDAGGVEGRAVEADGVREVVGVDHLDTNACRTGVSTTEARPRAKASA
jgi:hypothetical protein